MNERNQKFIYLDEQLPPIGTEVRILVVEVEHGKSTSEKLSISEDTGALLEDGRWYTTNDWDEGQPFAIVAWKPIEELPSEEEIRKHEILWRNVYWRDVIDASIHSKSQRDWT